MQKDEKLFQVYVPFDKFEPIESNELGLCIWCKSKTQKNTSHIFSRKLIISNQSNNYLKKSVCENCNSKFSSNCEDWLFKYSPIATWAEQMGGNSVIKNLKFIPNFIFQDSINEWVVINHDLDDKNIIPLQLIYNQLNFITAFFNGGDSSNFVADCSNQFEAFIETSFDKINCNEYTTYISEKLPLDFHARIMFLHGNIILIAKSEQDIDDLLTNFHKRGRSKNITAHNFTDFIGGIQKYHLHYRWSIRRYLTLGTKIAFELLALYEGSEFCLNGDFDGVRRQIFKNIKKQDYSTIKYVQGLGYQVNYLVPPGWIIANDNCINGIENMFKCPMLFETKRSHNVVIYQVGEFILCTVNLFNIEPLLLVLGRIPSKLKYWYGAKYDHKANELNHFYTIYDNKQFDKKEFNAVVFDNNVSQYASIFLYDEELKQFCAPTPARL
ncbi:MAG: hypothetical protein H7257_02510 [Taibaiella sp.]|nr:hypothetical protein [Taibaiella sp.]